MKRLHLKNGEAFKAKKRSFTFFPTGENDTEKDRKNFIPERI